MFALALFALPIMYADWRYRKIPNIYLIFIMYWVGTIRIISGIASLHVLSLAIATSILGALVLRMGIGDAKLFIITSLAMNLPTIDSLVFLISCIYLGAILQIILTWGLKGLIPRSIPMAFAIFFGSALYLAASSRASLQQYADALVNSW
jgi:Flp pilus assembly protein protease CpaA